MVLNGLIVDLFCTFDAILEAQKPPRLDLGPVLPLHELRGVTLQAERGVKGVSNHL